MTKPFWMIASLLMLEVLIIATFWPGDWTDRYIEKEMAMIRDTLGSEQQIWIKEKADEWYTANLIDNGLYDFVWNIFIPTDEEKARSLGMENMGDFLFDYMGGRLESLTSTVYQFMMRVALLMSWWPFMVMVLVPAVYDGYMMWKIKRTNFAYVSPFFHQYSLEGIKWLFFGLIMVFLAPIAVNPSVIPGFLMIVCAMCGICISNLQKRI